LEVQTTHRKKLKPLLDLVMTGSFSQALYPKLKKNELISEECGIIKFLTLVMNLARMKNVLEVFCYQVLLNFHWKTNLVEKN
jgi:hypothetical protein